MSILAPISVRDLASQCRDRARLDTADNMTAIILLLAAKTIDSQADRLESQARCLEHIETRIEQLEAKP